jgi:hypothetical protein
MADDYMHELFEESMFIIMWFGKYKVNSREKKKKGVGGGQVHTL